MQSNFVDVDESSTVTAPISVDGDSQGLMPAHRSPAPPASSSSAVLLPSRSSMSLGDSAHAAPGHTKAATSVYHVEDTSEALLGHDHGSATETRRSGTPALVPVVTMGGGKPELGTAAQEPKRDVNADDDDDAPSPNQNAVHVKVESGIDTSAALRAFIASWSASLGGVCVGMLVFAPHRTETAKAAGAPAAPGSPGSSAGGSHSPTTPATTSANSVLPPPVRLHYALAEITGLQSSAGTATVSFLMTDPGVDDEAIPLFELVPCPSTWLTRLGLDAMTPQRNHCSLLERVLDVRPADGPVHADAALAQLAAVRGPSSRTSQPVARERRPLFSLEDLYCLAKDDQTGPTATTSTNNAASAAAHAASDDGTYGGGGGEEPWAPARKAAKLETEPWTRGVRGHGDGPGSASASATTATRRVLLPHRHRVGKDKEVLSFSFEAPQSVHTFFAVAFQEVDRAVEKQHTAWVAEQRAHEANSGSSSSTARTAHVSAKAVRRTLWQPRKPPVVLCLFDHYPVLNRFRVYMSLRGHIVRLLDGMDVAPEAYTMAAEDVSGVAATSTTGGDQTASASAARRVCTGSTPVPPVAMAFSSSCKVWLCLMRDDAVVGGGPGSGTPSLPKLLANAPPIDMIVTFRKRRPNEETGQEVVVAEEAHEEEARLARAVADKDGADAAVHRLLPHLQSSRGRHLYCCFDHLPAEHATAGKVVKVSGSLFGANKVLVPASREQLLLAATVWAAASDAAASSTGGGGVTGGSTGSHASTSATSSSSVLTPALLEHIALGTFTDTSAANLFTTYQRTIAVITPTPPASPVVVDKNDAAAAVLPRVARFASIRDLHDAFYRDASRFGDVFPVFAAARALIEDIFADWQRSAPSSFPHAAPEAATPATTGASSLPSPVKVEPKDHDDTDADMRSDVKPPLPLSPLGPSSGAAGGRGVGVGSPRPPFPRIALVFPRGNPTGNPALMLRQFLHNLRQYLAPWMLFEVSLPCDGTQTAVPVLWHQRGGVLLLHCDESTAQLGALHHEADVVIACGKAAAAWLAANAMAQDSPGAHWLAPVPLYLAVLSEVEVAVDATRHVWVPYEPVDVSDGAVGLAHAVAHDALGLRVAHSEAQKAWRQLQHMVGVLASAEAQRAAGGGAGEGGRRRRRSASAAPNTTTASSGVGTAAPLPGPPLPASSARFAQEYATVPKLIQQAVLLHQHLDHLARGADAGGRWSAWVHSKAFAKSLALNAAATQPVMLGDIEVGTI